MFKRNDLVLYKGNVYWYYSKAVQSGHSILLSKVRLDKDSFFTRVGDVYYYIVKNEKVFPAVGSNADMVNLLRRD